MGSSVLVLSCGDKRAPLANDRAALGGEVAARVGDEVIPVSLVSKVAVDLHISADEALRRLVDDAIAASAARSRGLDRSPPSSWRLQSARARFTADRLLAEAKAKGPPRDREVEELSLEHWREVDRPPAVRTIHVIVLGSGPKDQPPTDAARALAEALRVAVLDATDEADFKARAEAVPHPADMTVRVESLPAFVATGELIDGPGGMVPEFAKAAHAIAKPGDTSPVVQSSFGLHVIRLLERIPERRMPFESRRVAFVEATNAMRAKAALDERLDELSKAFPRTVLPSAEQTMRSIHATSDEATP